MIKLHSNCSTNVKIPQVQESAFLLTHWNTLTYMYMNEQCINIYLFKSLASWFKVRVFTFKYRLSLFTTKYQQQLIMYDVI